MDMLSFIIIILHQVASSIKRVLVSKNDEVIK